MPFVKAHSLLGRPMVLDTDHISKITWDGRAFILLMAGGYVVELGVLPKQLARFGPYLKGKKGEK